MQRLTATALLILFSFLSCKKGNDKEDTNFHLSFKVDGASKIYNGNLLAYTILDGEYTTLAICGTPPNTSFDVNLGLYISNFPSKGNIASGQYSDTDTNFYILSKYEVNSVAHAAGHSVVWDANADNVTIANHLKINITSMDKNTIRGTFSGDYFLGYAKNGKKISITDGDFYIKLE
jgi:hypothetical protein